MGADIYGWIEFRHRGYHHWQQVVNLDGILSRYPAFQKEMFTESRGIPDDTGPRATYSNLDTKYGKTYLEYPEWEDRWAAIERNESHQSWGSWVFVHSTMEDLASLKGPENVRIVVGFHS